MDSALAAERDERRRQAILTKATAQRALREPHGEFAADGREPRFLIELIRSSLEDDKAEDIVVIDLSRKSSFADYMVIASGRSTRQVAAMAEHLAEKLKAAGLGRVAVEGLKTADWVLIDAGDVIVHLFRPEIRSFYDLEKMWGAAGGPARTLAGA